MGDSQETSGIAAYLPELILKLIFSFLSFEDLLNVQKVCTSWEYAVKNSVLWESISLPISCYTVDKVLPNTPYIQTVNGTIDTDTLLDAMINHLVDLRRLDCKIYNVSLEKYQMFIRKFKNLELIKISTSVLVIVGSLNILSACPKLKTIHLYYHAYSDNLLHVCNVMGDGFHALTKLHIVCNPDILKSHVSKNALSELLRKKINQLTELSLKYDDVNSNVLELIFNSTVLEKFEISINQYPAIPLNLSRMTNLKALTITVNRFFSSRLANGGVLILDLDVYKKIMFPKNIEHLKVTFPKYPLTQTCIISIAISSLQNLKVLSATNIHDPDLNEQVEKINTLPHLCKVSLTNCVYFSVSALEYILQCSELRELEISNMIFTDSTYESFKNCKYLGDLTLHACVLDPDKLVSTIASMKYLTNLLMYGCRQEIREGKLFDDELVNHMTAKCVQEKHNVKIYVWD